MQVYIIDVHYHTRCRLQEKQGGRCSPVKFSPTSYQRVMQTILDLCDKWHNTLIFYEVLPTWRNVILLIWAHFGLKGRLSRFLNCHPVSLYLASWVSQLERYVNNKTMKFISPTEYSLDTLRLFFSYITFLLLYLCLLDGLSLAFPSGAALIFAVSIKVGAILPPLRKQHFKQQFVCHRAGCDRLLLSLHKVCAREVCTSLRAERTILKHRNESTTLLSLLARKHWWQIEARASICCAYLSIWCCISQPFVPHGPIKWAWEWLALCVETQRLRHFERFSFWTLTKDVLNAVTFDML